MMQDVELWGGPHDGQSVRVREEQSEVRMPCAADTLDAPEREPGAVKPIVYAVYRRRGFRRGTPVFKWYGNGDV